MAFTEADIDRLKAAMAQGALRVRYADREVTYRSLDEMKETLALMQADVDAVAGRKPPRQFRFRTMKGLA